jgi:hypothetical protein
MMSAENAGGLLLHIHQLVTDAVKQLNISGDVQPSLVFEPTTGLTDSSPETVARQMNAQANVRFESARLVNTP